MKKILLILLLLPFIAKAQFPPGYTGVNARYSWIGGVFREGLHVPGYSTYPFTRTGIWVGDGAVAADTVSKKLYVRFDGVWKPLVDSASQSSGGGANWYPRQEQYSITFGENSYTDSTLVDNLASPTSNYFNNGLILKGNDPTITASYLTAWNYGYLINERVTQRIYFQVLDSSTVIEVGVGIKGSGAVNPRDMYNYISGTLGDSAGTTLYSIQTTAGDNQSSTGILINKGDVIELSVEQWADSLVTLYRNTSNNNSKRLVRRIITTNSGSYTRMGYPTLFFTKGHLKLIDWSISQMNFNVIRLGNSIAVGHNASKLDTSYVERLRTQTSAVINNTAKSAATTLDYLSVKNDFNFRNKVVFIDGLMGNDVAAGISYDNSKAYYAAIVDKLKANGNRIVHIDITYRTTFLGSGTWFDLYQRNKWLDTMYGAVDKVVHIDTTTGAMLSDGVHLNDAGHTNAYNSLYRDLPEYFERNRTVGPVTAERLVLTNSNRQFYTHDWFQAKDTLGRPRVVLRGGLVIYDPLSTTSSPIRISQSSSGVSQPSVFVVNTLNTVNQFGAFAYINANMAATSNVHLVYGGQAVSLNNMALFTFNYVGAGDSANYGSLSLHSNEVARFFGNRRFRILNGPLEIADLAGKPPNPASGYVGLNSRGDTLRAVNDNGAEFTLRLTNSGSFTPTGTAGANVDAVTPFDFHYTRIDNTVTFSGTVDIDETLAAGNTVVELSLPIPSNFGTTTDAAGVVTPTNAGVFGGYITASIANDRLVLTVLGVSTGTVTYTFTGSYKIL